MLSIRHVPASRCSPPFRIDCSLRAMTEHRSTPPLPPVPPSTEVRERALRMLAESQPALDLIDRAARDEACHYALNLETGDFPPFHLFRTAGGLLSLRTLEFASAGAVDRAVASLISEL